MRLIRTLLTTLAMAVAAPSLASGACQMPLAVYSEAGSGASVEFRSRDTLMVSNAFRMVLRNDVVLDGFVMWTDDPGRPHGALMHNCPEGDVTGDELAACTAWEGVIYAVGADGKIGTLPTESETSPPLLIFADLGPGIRFSTAYDMIGREGLPWDVFTLSGCQE